MLDALCTLWGSGRDLTALQMGVRATVLFGVALALVRISGMRSFGRKSSFDSIVVIMLGAVLSRPIYGAAAFIPIVAAGFVIVVVHRVIAMVTAQSPWLERTIKGQAEVLYRDGEIAWDRMRRAGISRADLEEAVRLRANREALGEVAELRLEASGEISVIVRHDS